MLARVVIMRVACGGGSGPIAHANLERIRELEEQLTKSKSSVLQVDTATPTGILDNLERGGRQKVFQDSAVKGTRKGEVSLQIDKLNLSDSKKKVAASVADKLMGFIADPKMSRTDKKALEIRMESLLVEWGVPPSIASKSPDYGGIAKLLAAAAAVAE